MSNFGKNKFFPLEKVKILKKNFTKFAQLKKRKKILCIFRRIGPFYTLKKGVEKLPGSEPPHPQVWKIPHIYIFFILCIAP